MDKYNIIDLLYTPMDIITLLLTILLTAIVTTFIVNYFFSVGKVNKSEYQAIQNELSNQVHLNQSQQNELNSLQQNQARLRDQYSREAKLNETQQIKIDQNQETVVKLHRQVAQLSANNEALLDRLNEQMKSFRVLQEASKNEFKNIAQQLLEEKSKSFATSQKKELNEVLAPLKERIQHFENKVDSSNKESIARHASLKEQIVGLSELNKQMSQEAQQLTNALKQDNKAQGNWGELILESILDKSGLEKGREYHLQESLVNDEGKTYRPDVIIDLPDGKKIIIDSKVSLKAYNEFVNPTPETDNKIALKAHCISLRKHIEGLAAKNYHDLYRIESPDFVMMFVPIETAFSAALSAQQDLYTYAFEKNIVIVTPSTLLATLKTVETLWRNDKQQRNAIGIATEAGKMYDKFAALVDDLNKIGQRIGQTQEAYNDSMKKLHTGKGNLLTRAEKLKQLGAKANKSLAGGNDGRRAE